MVNKFKKCLMKQNTGLDCQLLSFTTQAFVVLLIPKQAIVDRLTLYPLGGGHGEVTVHKLLIDYPAVPAWSGHSASTGSPVAVLQCCHLPCQEPATLKAGGGHEQFLKRTTKPTRNWAIGKPQLLLIFLFSTTCSHSGHRTFWSSSFWELCVFETIPLLRLRQGGEDCSVLFPSDQA